MGKPISVDNLGVRHVRSGDGPVVLLIKLPFHFHPIGLAYVASALREAGIGYDILDLSVIPTPDWTAILKARRYVAAACGGLFGDYVKLAGVFSDICKAEPELPLALGGAITWNVDSDVLLDHIPVDLLVVGEGEVTMPELIHRLASGQRRFDDIPGLVWRDTNGATKRSARRTPIDLNGKNYLPDWDIVDHGFYGFPSMSVLTGRGCTGTCTFCSPTNGRFRTRRVEHIMEELEQDNAKYAFGVFGFQNEILFSDAQTTLEFCSEYKRLKPHKPFGCLLRCDFPVEVLPDLCAAGCRHIHVGVESGSDRVLAAMGKRTTVEMIRKFMAAARKIDGLTVRTSIMFGNFDETAEDIDATVDLACELRTRENTMLVLNYPGTVNYRRAGARGLVTSEHDYLVNMTKLVGTYTWDIISKVNNGEATYPNISQLDTASLLKKTEDGLRRFHTMVYRAKVTRAEIRARSQVEVSTVCPFCGATRAATYDPAEHSPLDMQWECTCSARDHRPIYLSAFDLPLYGPHLRNCVERFRAAKRVAVLIGGDRQNADRFLWADHIGLDLEKVCAFVATPSLPEGYIVNHRIMPLSEVRALQPDLYVVPGGLPRNLLRELYGYSMAWELPEPLLCASRKFQQFKRDLGADVVHVLPLAAEAMGSRGPLGSCFSMTGFRLQRYVIGSVLKRWLVSTKDRLWETRSRKRLFPAGSRQLNALKWLWNVVFRRLPGRTP